MRMNRISAGLCFLSSATFFASGFAMAETCVQPDQLHVTAICRPFGQESFLAGMTAPMQSEGRLKVAPEKISWHMTSPFDVETILTPTAITRSINGATPQLMGPGGADISASIARLFG